MLKKQNLILILLIAGLTIKAQDPAIISRLEIYDLKNKTCSVVRQFTDRIEAPNWTPDGKYLVYNSRGLIYKIPVTGGDPEIINTGSINTCNNDHVISSDGNLLAVSARGPLGKSQVFILPFSGGEPKLVTLKAPSYLHGISPDYKTLSYCAERDGNYDVYIIPAAGGDEIRLTDSPGLDDGPEFSPDGRYIFYNSVRSGLMQIWRMKSDGDAQTQITFDESNNWFPHISPDGKKLVYLSYRKDDVEPGSHPANKNVELRLIPSRGGKPKTLVRLFGGQGTINVNSWSPDSRKFAFVSYVIRE